MSFRRVFDNYNSSAPAVAFTLATGLFYISRSPVLFLPDGYIYLTYAERIAGGLGWGINPHETTFATTSPLWTALCALIRVITPAAIDLVRPVQFVGLALFIATIVVMDSTLRRAGVAFVVRLTVLSVFAIVPFNGLFYSIGGMETPLFLFLFFSFVRVVVGGTTSPGSAVLLGILSALLYLTRIEGVLCLAALAIILACRSELPKRAVAQSLFVASIVFLAIIAPWQLFSYLSAGVVVPTSGKGRLYCYFYDTIRSIELAQYLSLSVLQRAGYIGEIFRTRFIEHPVVLLFAFIPAAFTVGSWVTVRLTRTSLPPAAAIALPFLAIYAMLNFALYFAFQPYIFQRYLAASYPSAFMAFAIVAGPLIARIAATISPTLRAVAILAGVGFFVVNNAVAVRYFDYPTKRDAELIALLQRVKPVMTPECRLAAEPLGIAAYFTNCRIIDLGGLINPDFWDVCIATPHRQRPAADIRYAVAKSANYALLPDPLPPAFSDRLVKIDATPDNAWAVYRVTPGAR
jgi:hypothetical protein